MTLFARIFTIAFAVFCIAGQAVAQESQPTPEEKAYKFRTSLFQTFAWKFGKLVGALQASDEAAFKANAKDLEYLAGMLEEGFQIKDSLPEGTTAKPTIWEDYDTFTEKADTLRQAAASLSEDGAMASFDPRGFGSKNCGGCHRVFRIKQ